MENNILEVNVDGKDEKCEILFTYFSEEYNNHYIIFRPLESDSITAMIYKDDDSGKGTGELQPITTDKEWEMIEEVVNKWLEEQDKNESDCCSGGCCGCDCDDEEEDECSCGGCGCSH